jgi:hypothetical protein
MFVTAVVDMITASKIRSSKNTANVIRNLTKGFNRLKGMPSRWSLAYSMQPSRRDHVQRFFVDGTGDGSDEAKKRVGLDEAKMNLSKRMILGSLRWSPTKTAKYQPSCALNSGGTHRMIPSIPSTYRTKRAMMFASSRTRVTETKRCCCVTR